MRVPHVSTIGLGVWRCNFSTVRMGGKGVWRQFPVVHSMKTFLLFICMVVLAVGCSTTAKKVTVNGDTYTLVEPARGNQVALWEKRGNTNYWYTPSLQWMVHPESPPSFNTILR